MDGKVFLQKGSPFSGPNANVVWSGSVDPGVYWYQTGKDVFYSFSAIGQTARFSVEVTNSCGTS